MTIANWCVVAACVLPVLTAGIPKISAAGKSRQEGGYDNRQPRDWAARQQGWQARAMAAQANGFEALPLFVAGVLLAQQAHADQARIDVLALSFVAIRLIYVAAYVMNQASLRSLVWTAGMLVSISLVAMG